ncbi:MAG: DUF2782 domain-containing protein [Acidobacteria bacterium]|nr:DUF2782 domain-containing protein [Acidobacteriota bacterium]
MKTHLKYKVYGFVSFAVFLFGCSTVNTSSLSNKLEIKTSSSPTPLGISQNNEGKFIRQEGWKIPLPEKKEKMRVLERDVMSETGNRVKRTITIYNPIGDFFFYIDHPTSNLGIQMMSGLLQLESIWEVKVKEKIYSYTVIVRKAVPNAQTDESILTRHEFPYRYFDIDGDGKFETLVADDSDILVPSWVTQ